jgi:hypothetical protein
MAAPFDFPGTHSVMLEVVERGGAHTARIAMDVVVQGLLTGQ